MTSETQVAAQRLCQAWADHAWVSGRLASTGRHPTLGYYQRVEVRCARCGKVAVETRWLGVIGLPPLDPNGSEDGRRRTR